MNKRVGILESKKQIVSILLVWMMAAACIVILVSVDTPTVRGVDHLGFTIFEDGNPTYDADGLPNQIVVWHPNVMHNITIDYVVDPGYTLIIPPLNYTSGAKGETWVDFQPPNGNRISVQGTLITSDNGDPGSKTAFWRSQGFTTWDGIFFLPGSSGTIVDCRFIKPDSGVQFLPGSTLLAPINNTLFDDFGQYGLKMDGVLGDTNIVNGFKDITTFNDSVPSGIGLDIAHGMLNISSEVTFNSHGPDLSSLHISNATVSVDGVNFMGSSVSGNSVHIEGTGSNDTVLSETIFTQELAGSYYVRVDGSAPLIDDCSFDLSTGALTVIANENATGVPAHPILRNPLDSGGGIFDNSTLNATGSSSVTLQWWVDVHVIDPDGNDIPSSQVIVTPNGGTPDSKITDGGGMAEGFLVTELIVYNDTVTSYDPFNISAENNTVLGYADPEPIINESMQGGEAIVVVVPFNLIPNTLPIVTYISTPVGVQSGYITIDYILMDPDPGDNGNLSIQVEFTTNGVMPWIWLRAAAAPTCPPTTGLLNNTPYQFIWDSRLDIIDRYNDTVYIRINASDKSLELGPENRTGVFTVDNIGPQLLSGPTVTPTNTTALIEWTVDEASNATVWYGLDGVFANEAVNNSATTTQSVPLTGLLPGRNYTYVINSTDLMGNKFSSDPINFTFETEIYIELCEGWNMISMPPMLSSSDLGDVLSTIAGSWDTVEWYDVGDTDDHWKINNTNKPYGNDLDTYFPNRMGLWIHMINDDTLIPDHTVPDPGNFTVVSLLEGWNFVGYASAVTRSIPVALAGMSYDQVQTYDAATSQWLSYDGGSGSLTDMELGRGYWIHCTGAGLWTLDYV